jgi:signal transduction histidine kinase
VLLVGYGSYKARIVTLEARERELLRVVADRTQDLEAVNTSLREAIRLKEEVVSMVAHEFRAPLTVLQGYGDLLGARVTDDDSRRMLGLMNDQTRRLTNLTADTLTLSLIEGGGLRLDREPVRLGEMVRAVAEAHSRQTGRQIVTEIPKDPIVVDADPRRLHQVLDNLLSNAVNYSPNGPGVRVTLDATANEAHVSVADMGIGIQAGDLPKLFQKFGRLDNAKRVRTTGTGLGLYICRWFVEAHGGRIWAESELGKGSTFHVAIPLFGVPHEASS